MFFFIIINYHLSSFGCFSSIVFIIFSLSLSPPLLPSFFFTQLSYSFLSSSSSSSSSFRSLSSSLIPLPYYPPFRPPPHHYHSHIHHSSSSSSSYSSSSYSSPDRRRKYIIREICKFQVLHINGAKTVISSLIGSAEFQKYFHIGFSVQM